jgi:hypothetical protein
MCLRGRKSEGVGEKLHNKEIGKLNFYSLADIIRVIELRRSKWVEHVEFMGKIHAGFFRSMRERDNL